MKTATKKGQRDDVAQLHFVGNCPAGWFWRTADKEQWSRKGSFGEKASGVLVVDAAARGYLSGEVDWCFFCLLLLA